MKAAILIGGRGTRLRPYTERTPKSLLPVLGRPFLFYQLEQLKAHGVKEVVLCTGHQAEQFRRLGSGKKLGLKLKYSHETQPLGTGGALRGALKHFAPGEPMLALNGDVLLDRFDFTAFLAAHKKRQALASIALASVEDPTLYGLVQTDADGRVIAFVEKPSADEAKGSMINAGAYLLERSALEEVPEGQPCSIEREIFPQLVKRGAVWGFESRGYWIDYGTVDRYHEIHLAILDGKTAIKPKGADKGKGLFAGKNVKLGRGLRLQGKGWKVVDDGVTLGPEVTLTGRVYVGPKTTIAAGAELQDCVVLDGARVPEGKHLSKCVFWKGELPKVGKI